MRIDGEDISPPEQNVRFAGSRYGGPTGWLAGRIPIRKEPGDYTIEFVVDYGAVQGTFHLNGMMGGPGPAETWPETVFKDVQTIELNVTVLEPGESPIALVVPEKHRQTIIDGLHVTALRVSQLRRELVSELIFHSEDNPPVPLSFDVAIQFGDREIEIGRFSTNGRSSSRSGFSGPLPDFPPDIDAVDVIFHPNVKAVESQPEWTEIWGGDIVIKNVPVVRVGQVVEPSEGR